ncbi:adenylate/guanylate cyclase domain-containing protein [Thioalkalicoccus limnaeus]|uniref:Adenylate/guanylate cyclase domain-containing protein n=1 Tax=Thioalkalicoccus limnaeus TaxID=120681 RepID=A0ABV4BK68_9GAMM
MQQANRERFETRLVEAIEDILREPLPDSRRNLLRVQVAELIEGVLFADQPIVETEITVLLADLRGFSSLSASLPPNRVSALLNRFFIAMSEVIVAHDGLIDKFIGDAVMALFGAPRRQDDDLRRALACAVAMQQAMQAFNATGVARGEPPLYIGIALSTGPAMVGNFGSMLYSEYTAIGDTVNLAARMEIYSLRGQILLSEASRRAAGDSIKIGQVNEVRPKGQPEPVRFYELRAIKGRANAVVPRIELRNAPRIKVDIPLVFRRVEGKKVMPEHLSGRIQDLGYNGMCADLPVCLPPCAEIVARLEPCSQTGELYARVVRTRPGPGYYRTSLAFTSVGTPAQQVIKRYVDDQLWRR